MAEMMQQEEGDKALTFEQMTINQATEYVNQLKKETGTNRMMVSEASELIMKFCEENFISDPLIGKKKKNPYAEKKLPCDLL